VSGLLWFILGYCVGMVVCFLFILFLNWPTDEREDRHGRPNRPDV
jgi:hypothetical protein